MTVAGGGSLGGCLAADGSAGAVVLEVSFAAGDWVRIKKGGVVL